MCVCSKIPAEYYLLLPEGERTELLALVFFNWWSAFEEEAPPVPLLLLVLSLLVRREEELFIVIMFDAWVLFSYLLLFVLCRCLALPSSASSKLKMGPEDMEREAKLNLLEKRFCFSFCGLLLLKSLLLLLLLAVLLLLLEFSLVCSLLPLLMLLLSLLLKSNGFILLKTELAVAPKDVGKIDETSKLPPPIPALLLELVAAAAAGDVADDGDGDGDDGKGDDESVSTDESMTTLTAEEVVVMNDDVVALVNVSALRKTDDGDESESPSKNLLLQTQKETKIVNQNTRDERTRRKNGKQASNKLGHW